MKTYQDLAKLGDTDRTDFVYEAISEHQSSDAYRQAIIAKEYAAQRNVTITKYQKTLYDMAGRAKPDLWSPNYKLCSNFFDRFVTQQVQFLLGNGCSWDNDATASKLGDDFDGKLREADKHSLIQGVSFGFMNYDHLDVFELAEFVPLYDEENGALMAGIRFWQIDKDKPLRATLYEIDGYTDYLYKQGGGTILNEKRTYKLSVKSSEADGDYIFDGENYPVFPIVPLWANQYKQSELIGLRGEIDAYDFIKSGFANDLDGAQLYWVINNAGGMDDIDLAKFIERMKTVHAAVMEDDGAKAEAHEVNVPHAAREALLDRLRSDMYEDYMALDTKNLGSGAITATQIRAAYEPMNSKADEHEALVKDFIAGLLYVIGVDDSPTFARSTIVNTKEEIDTIVAAATFLPQEYVIKRILSILGDSEHIDDVMTMLDNEDASRFAYSEEPQEEPQEVE